MNRADGTEFRETLRAVVARSLPADPVALLFSAGTDSLTVLWTLMDLGADVTCYTFRLSSFESTDARAARAACKHWRKKHVLVKSGDDVKGDVEKTIRIIKSYRKTHVEVMYAYRALMEVVSERVIYSGIQADTLYGSNKNASIRCGKTDAADFARYRRDLLKSPDQEGLAQANAVARAFGKTLMTPYSSSEVREWMLRWSWKDLNKPKQKMPPLLGFADRFAEIPIYRFDNNLQCGSRIRELMEETFNGKQRKAYKDILISIGGK